jgi:helix-turn-helix protein
MSKKDLLTTAQAARLRHCSRRTLERERQAGNGPVFIKDRRRVLYSQDELLEWLYRQSRTSTSKASPPAPSTTPSREDDNDPITEWSYMAKKDKPLELDSEALVQRMIENREKRLAKKPWPDMHFYVKPGSFVTKLGPRGGYRGAYVNSEAFFFHLDEVVTVDIGPYGTQIIFESSPPWENKAVRAADVEIKTTAEVEAFLEERRRPRTQQA